MVDYVSYSWRKEYHVLILELSAVQKFGGPKTGDLHMICL